MVEEIVSGNTYYVVYCNLGEPNAGSVVISRTVSAHCAGDPLVRGKLRHPTTNLKSLWASIPSCFGS